MINYFSAKNLKITVDPQAAVNSGTVSKENASKIVKDDKMDIQSKLYPEE